MSITTENNMGIEYIIKVSGKDIISGNELYQEDAEEIIEHILDTGENTPQTNEAIKYLNENFDLEEYDEQINQLYNNG